MAGDGGGGGGMWWHDLAAGGMSGIGARALTHPLDTLKAQQQVAGAFAAGGTGGGGGGSARVVARAPLLGVLRQTLALEGAAGLYRGFGAVAVGTVPANTLYFGGYEAAKAAIESASPNAGSSGHMAAGLAAQAVANVVFTPVDVVKERMQTQRLALEAGAAGAREFRHAGEALAAVVRSEGLFRGLFKGYGATLAVWGPWNMLYFAMYEAAKDACAAHMGLARPRGGEAEELPAWACAGAAAAAASGACVLTQPLDTAKTRLQAVPGSELSLAGALRQLSREGVLRTMTVGLAARTLNVAQTSALSFYMYEAAKGWLRN